MSFYDGEAIGGVNEFNGDVLIEAGSEDLQRLGGTTLRIILSPTRSGSTALLRCFENNSSVDEVFHQPVKSGFREGEDFDYSFFEPTRDEAAPLYVAKETVGGFVPPEATFSPLPNFGKSEQIGPWLASPREIERLEPLMLIRDPMQTWGSIERLNQYSEGISLYHSPFEYFETSYRKVIEFLLAARDLDLPVRCVTQEMLGLDPQAVLSQICRDWNMPWQESMIHWTLPYGVKTWFSDEARERMDTDPRFRRSKESLQASNRYDYRPSGTEHIKDEHTDLIENELYPLYYAAVEKATEDYTVSDIGAV